MKNTLKQMIHTFIPFIMLGVMAALCVGLVLMFSSILIWGVFIGGILWVVAMAKNFLFPEKKTNRPDGRIIEHDKDK